MDYKKLTNISTSQKTSKSGCCALSSKQPGRFVSRTGSLCFLRKPPGGSLVLGTKLTVQKEVLGSRL